MARCGESHAGSAQSALPKTWLLPLLLLVVVVAVVLLPGGVNARACVHACIMGVVLGMHEHAWRGIGRDQGPEARPDSCICWALNQ